MTYLEIVNQVLSRMRLSAVASVTASTYSSMIGNLVNQAKREVEGAYPWLVLHGEVIVSTIADTAAYSLTGMGQRAKIERVHNTTSGDTLRAIDWYRMTRMQDFDSAASGRPQYWRINGVSSGDPIIEFEPAPDATYSISVYGIAPQADLSANTDVLLVPSWPVVLNTYLLALLERGDDRGLPYQHAQREYESALSDAVASDSANDFGGYSSDWEVQ
jgi:hypothetical protein